MRILNIWEYFALVYISCSQYQSEHSLSVLQRSIYGHLSYDYYVLEFGFTHFFRKYACSFSSVVSSMTSEWVSVATVFDMWEPSRGTYWLCYWINLWCIGTFPTLGHLIFETCFHVVLPTRVLQNLAAFFWTSLLF